MLVLLFGIFWWLWSGIVWNIISVLQLDRSLFGIIYWAGIGGVWTLLKGRHWFRYPLRWGSLLGIGAGICSGALWMRLEWLLQDILNTDLLALLQFVLFGSILGIFQGSLFSSKILSWKTIAWAATTALSWTIGGLILWMIASQIGHLCPGFDCFSGFHESIRKILWWIIVAMTFIVTSSVIFWVQDMMIMMMRRWSG
ncbi:hypothetical protein [Thermoflexus hugenholtzii]|nr:hypothetical protein [Thermoflexus hugenholtzii]